MLRVDLPEEDDEPIVAAPNAHDGPGNGVSCLAR
jgi:hypothetical protein